MNEARSERMLRELLCDPVAQFGIWCLRMGLEPQVAGEGSKKEIPATMPHPETDTVAQGR